MQHKVLSIGDRVLYRVLKNPQTAPDGDYTAPADVIEIAKSGAVLTIYPKRADPFVRGPIPHISTPDEHHSGWEEIE